MSVGGRPVIQRKEVRDAVDRAFAGNADQLIELVAAEFKPLYYQTLERALHAEQLVERCLGIVERAASRDDRPAQQLLHELAGWPRPRRWWQVWRR